MKQAAPVGLIAPCTRHAERVNVGGRSGRERERETGSVEETPWPQPFRKKGSVEEDEEAQREGE